MKNSQKEVQNFENLRNKQNDTVLKYANQAIKRFFSLDGQTYRAGILDAKTKELLGLTASFVLRCDDCIRYHLLQCFRAGVTVEELMEALNVGVIVGGSITIPHLRRAMEFWEAISQETETDWLQPALAIVEADGEWREKEKALVEMLHQHASNFDWVGFYWANPNREDWLILGEFSGKPTEHTEIPFGKGICGQVAVSKETMVVDDVCAVENYIACSLDVRSEIVAPIMVDGRFVGQIDIDSDTPAAFSEETKRKLEQLANAIGKVFEEKSL